MQIPGHPWAAIDIGSNTMHLVVKRYQESRWNVLSRHGVMTQLGRCVAQTGMVPPAEKQMIVRTLQGLVLMARKAGATDVLIGATEAMRRAKNGKSFLGEMGRQIGYPVRLISKEREAALSLLGVRDDLSPSGVQLFIDSGGGSAELSLCRGRRPLKAVSIPIGSGILSWELRHDPPEPTDLLRLMKPILQALVSAPRTPRPSRALVTGGSAHNLLRMAGKGLTELTLDGINDALRKLLKHPAAHIAKKFDMDPIRAKTLGPGALILGTVMDTYGLDRISVTPSGVRDGMLDAFREKGERWWQG